MRILEAILPLLLLGVRVENGHSGDGDSRDEDNDSGDEPADTGSHDTCNYSEKRMRCGDKCAGSDGCVCGNAVILPWYGDQHCCLPPGGSCTMRMDRWEGGVCSDGWTQSMSTPCNTTMGPRCYNSYNHSLIIGRQAHYTCPDTCVPMRDMCQGISWCEGDTQVCGPDLRCPSFDGSYYDIYFGNCIKVSMC